MNELQATGFWFLAFLLVGYTVLDGFDLGVGFWYAFARGEKAKRTLMHAIAPFWDGNEVWLVTAGAILFAAFPPVYASVFSGFYLPLMALLLALILRAVSIEFRAHEESPRAKKGWDLAFAGGSTLATVLFGVAFGNLLRGIPLDAQGNFTGTVLTLLNPFALLVGGLNLAMLATHGALYLVMKTEDPLATRVRRWATVAWVVYLPLAVLTVIAASLLHPHLLTNYRATPLLWAVPVLGVTAILLAGGWHAAHKAGLAFLASAAAIALLLVAGVAGLFPALVPSLGAPGFSLTAANASSSDLTLRYVLWLTTAGMVVVIGYTVWVYRVFRGKADPDEGY